MLPRPVDRLASGWVRCIYIYQNRRSGIDPPKYLSVRSEPDGAPNSRRSPGYVRSFLKGRIHFLPPRCRRFRTPWNDCAHPAALLVSQHSLNAQSPHYTPHFFIFQVKSSANTRERGNILFFSVILCICLPHSPSPCGQCAEKSGVGGGLGGCRGSCRAAIYGSRTFVPPAAAKPPLCLHSRRQLAALRIWRTPCG